MEFVVEQPKMYSYFLDVFMLMLMLMLLFDDKRFFNLLVAIPTIAYDTRANLAGLEQSDRIYQDITFGLHTICNMLSPIITVVVLLR